MSGVILADAGMDVVTASGEVVRVLDLLGVTANVLLAGMLAREKRFDLVGFLVLGTAAGLGGGMIRDTLLQRGTPIALTDLSYLAVAFTTALVAYLIHMEGRWWHRGARFFDAIALGTWGAVGAQKAIAAGLHWMPAILLGTITAVGGGMVRDLLLNRTPIVFGGNTLYATCASAAAVVVVLADWLTSSRFQGLTTLVAAMVGAAFCLVSYRLGWRLPAARDWRLGRRPRPS